MEGLRKLSDFKWEIPTTFKPGMRVPGTIFADEELVEMAGRDRALEQVANVAFLPGIVGSSLAMPDIHWGYGFPIGGVAAFSEEGVVSPGGVGFDISCGVRLVKTNLTEGDVRPVLRELMSTLASNVPKGLGIRGRIQTPKPLLRKVFTGGARSMIELGYGRPEDLEHIEFGGAYPGADPDRVSERAYERGRDQVGSLGSGNHFLELQVVDEIFLPDVAREFGLDEKQVVVMIHSGSRGVGHQICTDYLKVMDGVVRRTGLELPDRQLGCAPIGSPEADDYLGAMACAANFAISNRQAMMHWTRTSFEAQFKTAETKLGMELLYDVSHNIARFETHQVEGRPMRLCVHRKGATASFPPGHPDIPEDYSGVGQPVLIPGDMGTHSYVLVGASSAMNESFGSTCHGAGRTMSRTKAKKLVNGGELKSRLESRGILVFGSKASLLAEEAPEAYKDVTRVVDVCEGAGLSRKVARMSPIGVLKG